MLFEEKNRLISPFSKQNLPYAYSENVLLIMSILSNKIIVILLSEPIVRIITSDK